MPYSQLSDNYYDQPELINLSRSALCLTTEAMTYCSRAESDGFIAAGALRRITTSDDPFKDAQELVESGYWNDVDGGWQIPWKSQRTKEQREADREADRARKARRRKHDSGDHTDCPSYFTCRKGKKSSTPESTPDSTPESGAQDKTIQDKTIKGFGLGIGEVSKDEPSLRAVGPPLEAGPSARSGIDHYSGLELEREGVLYKFAKHRSESDREYWSITTDSGIKTAMEVKELTGARKDDITVTQSEGKNYHRVSFWIGSDVLEAELKRIHEQL